MQTTRKGQINIFKVLCQIHRQAVTAKTLDHLRRCNRRRRSKASGYCAGSHKQARGNQRRGERAQMGLAGKPHSDLVPNPATRDPPIRPPTHTIQFFLIPVDSVLFLRATLKSMVRDEQEQGAVAETNMRRGRERRRRSGTLFAATTNLQVFM